MTKKIFRLTISLMMLTSIGANAIIINTQFGYHDKPNPFQQIDMYGWCNSVNEQTYKEHLPMYLITYNKQYYFYTNHFLITVDSAAKAVSHYEWGNQQPIISEQPIELPLVAKTQIDDTHMLYDFMILQYKCKTKEDPAPCWVSFILSSTNHDNETCSYQVFAHVTETPFSEMTQQDWLAEGNTFVVKATNDVPYFQTSVSFSCSDFQSMNWQTFLAIFDCKQNPNAVNITVDPTYWGF